MNEEKYCSDEFSPEADFEWEVSEDGVVITRYIGKETDIKHEIKKFQSPFFIGLFWFSDNYLSLVRTEGLIEVPAEILFSDRRCNMDPDTCHLEYEKDLSIPRGRVAFSDDIFDICVGTDVPSHINIQAVKEAFGLSQLDDSRVQIFHDPHWNTKGQRRHK